MTAPNQWSGMNMGLPATLAQGAVAGVRDLLVNRDWDFFSYSANWVNVAGGAGDTDTIQIDRDAVYFAFGATSTVFEPASPQTLVPGKPFTLELKAGGSGRFFFEDPVPIGTITGDGNNPMWWPFYARLEPASTLQCNVQNLTAGTAYTGYLTLIGVKVYDFQNDPGPRQVGAR